MQPLFLIHTPLSHFVTAPPQGGALSGDAATNDPLADLWSFHASKKDQARNWLKE